MTLEDNYGKNSVIKSKWNGNLGSNETDTVSIKITYTKYLICIKQDVALQKQAPESQKYGFCLKQVTRNFFGSPEAF